MRPHASQYRTRGYVMGRPVSAPRPARPGGPGPALHGVAWQGRAESGRLNRKVRRGQAMAEPVTWDDLHALLEELRALARGLLGLEDSAQSLQMPARVLGT